MPQATLGTLYEANQQMYQQLATPSDKIIEKQLNKMLDWIINNLIHCYYFMLLCREKYDFTIFSCSQYTDYENLKNEIKEVLQSRGTIIEIRLSDNKDMYECWVREEETKEVSMYAFFDCNDWVIEIE